MTNPRKNFIFMALAFAAGAGWALAGEGDGGGILRLEKSGGGGEVSVTGTGGGGGGQGLAGETGGGGEGAFLEGNWEPYDSTTLSVKRSITVERDGQQYEADVYTPVLTRRGAVFLNGEQTAEMRAIRLEVAKLVGETEKIQESARKLSARYAALMAKAKAGMVETADVEKHRGKVEFVSREEN